MGKPKRMSHKMYLINKFLREQKVTKKNINKIENIIRGRGR